MKNGATKTRKMDKTYKTTKVSFKTSLTTLISGAEQITTKRKRSSDVIHN